MNFYLIPGDNEAPLARLAISGDGSSALAGTGAGTILRYEMDGNPPEELARPRPAQAIAGLAFAGAGLEALALAMTSPTAGDILRIHETGGVELLYADAPFRFGGLAMSADGSFGLMSGGGQLLRYFPEQRSYLPVETPADLLLAGIAFAGETAEAIVVGGGQSGGFVAAYEPRPETGRLRLLPSPALPALETVASDAAGRGFLAGGQPGTLAWIAKGEPVRTVPGPPHCTVHGIAFHPAESWALVATGPAAGAEKGAQLFRFDGKSLNLSPLYEGPPGAGAFLSVGFHPNGARALVGTEWGQLLEIAF
ncbi:MAG: hypothetical protein HY303_16315 [Candidatus Wallbacteria bacterium]|nr:hypothetical protein [Candidatus Wallbacteria bacterium]